MAELKLIGIGNSVGVVLPKELLMKLGLQKGDILNAIEMPDGVRLTTANADFEAQMTVARRFMQECRTSSANSRSDGMARARTVLAIHDEMLAGMAAALGARDEGLLESALARPLTGRLQRSRSRRACCAFTRSAITCNHPFVDGNKRTASGDWFVPAIERHSLSRGARRRCGNHASGWPRETSTRKEFIAWVRANAVADREGVANAR